MEAGPDARERRSSRFALAWALTAVLALLLSLFNQWLWFGVLMWVILLLGAAIGYGPQSSRPPILAALAGMLLLYCGLLLGVAWTFRPESPAVLFLGLPVPTALFVYGIWPAGTLMGLLYALEFRRSVLPEDKLQAFLAEFGEKR